MLNQEIGNKIAAYRARHDLTIRELAEETGLSAALLSQLERGLGNPTLYALSTLAKTLGISLSQLVETPVSNESLILRKKDRHSIYTASGQPVHDILSSSIPHARIELTLMELPPHTQTEGGMDVRHLYEEEIGLVLEGNAVFYLDREKFLLEEGDSVRILPGVGHMTENETDAPLKVLFARYRGD